MAIWALSDLHLSFSVPEKSMEVFGPAWKNYTEKVEHFWKLKVAKEDLILIAGDISWAMRPEEALIDLEWIHALPGTKVIIKGNHDFWWPSATKLAKILPPSIHFIQNNAFHWNEVAIGGSRLWDSSEYRFDSLISFQENPRAKKKSEEELQRAQKEEEKIFMRELERLKLSLSCLNPKAPIKIAMTHYPPIGNDLLPSLASQILEQYGVQICVFGHLHSVKKEKPLFGKARDVHYFLTSCDYLDFSPLCIF